MEMCIKLLEYNRTQQSPKLQLVTIRVGLVTPVPRVLLGIPSALKIRDKIQTIALGIIGSRCLFSAALL